MGPGDNTKDSKSPNFPNICGKSGMKGRGETIEWGLIRWNAFFFLISMERLHI